MTSKQKNPVWAFFASVKLALVLIFCISVTSIIGTVIQQNRTHDQYIQDYGETLANVFMVLDFTDMYSSWWFLTLLALFTMNLIACSLERIPRVFRILKKDNLATSRQRIEKMKTRGTVQLDQPMPDVTGITKTFLAKKGWKSKQIQKEDGILLFAEKGGWSRFGVYIVHLSILMILFGAIIGSHAFARVVLNDPHFAFKGSIMIPATRETDFIFSFHNNERIDLGFTVRCNSFSIEYWPNGMVRTYLSRITILEDGEPVDLGDGKTVHYLKVNTPLTYRGITFYQSSYRAFSDFVVILTNMTNNSTMTEFIPPAQKYTWEEGNASIGIINAKSLGEAVKEVKVWFSDSKGETSTFWLDTGKETIIKGSAGDFKLQVKQLHSTGLQVAKDPGVWIVYVGFGFMMFGLCIAFFMSHRKLFVYIREEDNQTRTVWGGTAHKNKAGFDKTFSEIVEDFKKTTT